MTRQMRLTIATARSAVSVDLAPRQACNEAVIHRIFRSEPFDSAYGSREEASAELPTRKLIDRMRNFQLCAGILDIRKDDALRSGLIAFRDAVLDAAHDASLKITVEIGLSVCTQVDEDALRIDPDKYVSPLRQQELIDLADAGQGASAVRLAVREAAASFGRQLHMH